MNVYITIYNKYLAYTEKIDIEELEEIYGDELDSYTRDIDIPLKDIDYDNDHFAYGWVEGLQQSSIFCFYPFDDKTDRVRVERRESII